MSMTKRGKLTKSERLEIEILLGKGYSLRSIASAIERSPNTISYEITVNGGRSGYNALHAHQYAQTRKKDTRRAWSKIEEIPELKAYIIEKLIAHWNPDEISGRMKEEKQPWYISKTAIYAWLRSVYGQKYCVYLYTKRYHTKKRLKKTERVMITERVSIHERSQGAERRSRYGHWEYDTIISGKGCGGGLSVGLERKARLMVATKVATMSTFEHMTVLQQSIHTYKTLSITFDNGIENKAHRTLGIPTFFCDPYSSHQKGSVENGNRMLRRYFPKGTNFREVSQKAVDRAVALINNKPRKILNYKTALEVSRAVGMMKSDKKD